MRKQREYTAESIYPQGFDFRVLWAAVYTLAGATAVTSVVALQWVQRPLALAIGAGIASALVPVLLAAITRRAVAGETFVASFAGVTVLLLLTGGRAYFPESWLVAASALVGAVLGSVLSIPSARLEHRYSKSDALYLAVTFFGILGALFVHWMLAQGDVYLLSFVDRFWDPLGTLLQAATLLALALASPSIVSYALQMVLPRPIDKALMQALLLPGACISLWTLPKGLNHFIVAGVVCFLVGFLSLVLAYPGLAVATKTRYWKRQQRLLGTLPEATARYLPEVTTEAAQ